MFDLKCSLKALIMIVPSIALVGCVSPGNVEMPIMSAPENSQLNDKTISTEILYSQPKAELIGNGEQLPLTPIKNTSFSFSSAKVINKFNKLLESQLPKEVQIQNTDDTTTSDYNLRVELVAHDKDGPAYTSYDIAESFGKNILTLGLSPDEYTVVADFDVKYILAEHDKTIYERNYVVKDEVEHEKSDYDFDRRAGKLEGQLLEKHIMLTLNLFLSELPKT